MLIFFSSVLFSQGRPGAGRLGSIGSRISRGGGSGGVSDSLQRRDKSEDSITIYFQLPSSTQNNKLDSSVNDFTKRFPIPADHAFLGNDGTATHSFLFSPIMKSGWDAGFHAYDVYRWKPEEVRFFNTTRPYSELGYLLGGRTEQIIELTHTQNIRPNWNALFQYRLINSPGYFKSQKTNHNDYLFTSWYQSVNKRYNNYFVIVANAFQSDENGGIKTDQDYLNDPIYNDRFNIPTKLGGDVQFGRNFFSTKLTTGNRYRDFTFKLRQQYDLGRKDSIVGDSTVIPLFYPRLRFEHTFTYRVYKFQYIDKVADSVYYQDYYDITLPSPIDSVFFYDRWKIVENDFSIYQFPDANNQQQFIKVGAAIQNLFGKFYHTGQNKTFYNALIHGEYRNKTKDQKWDMVAAGDFYVTGLNAADYEARIKLKRFAGKKQAYVELGFENVNRSPSFVFDSRSNFYLDAARDFKNENITHLSASFYQPIFNIKLSGNYYLFTNYTYYTEFYKPQQDESLFNLLQVSVEKLIRLGKNWVWHADVYLQQKTGDVQLNLPLIFMRNRIGYEGKLGFRNLNIAFGLDSRYHTPFKADGYSPLLGRFFFQDSVRINNLPDIAGYLHFRIRNFRTFLRAENLNTVTLQNGFGFRNHNFAAPDYPYPGLVIRLSVYWSFVN